MRKNTCTPTPSSRWRRIARRAEKDGWVSRAEKFHVQYERWLKSFRNVTLVDDGATYWRFNGPKLIHKGRKP